MIQNIKGTKDILPGEVGEWQFLENILRSTAGVFGYDEIRTPVIEYTELFSRSAGEGSDVVNKEMYTFEDRSHDSLCLRPELTAAVARVVLQNTLLRTHPTMRLWYYGPCFRYERPQLGRQRQFHQFGAEAIGSARPEADADVINLAFSVLQNYGIDDATLEINSIGSEQTRILYKDALVAYLSDHASHLSEDSRRRLQTNPLRILDSKEENDRRIVKNAPNILDFLDSDSRQHFEQVGHTLNALGIPFTVNPLLVRGLDYYSHTVFEFKTHRLGAQDALGGGGRYNNLFESLQGPPAPGVGFAFGVERLLLVGKEIHQIPTPFTVYVIAEHQHAAHCLHLAQHLRHNGIRTLYDLQQKSFKAQLKDADRNKATVAIFIGEQETKDKTLTVKDMRNGSQKTLPNDPLAIADHLKLLSTL